MALRACKTNANRDDFKVLMAGGIAAIFILIGSQVIPRFLEYRWYRDITNLTPFYNVTLQYSKLIDNNHIIIGGSLTKRRCDFNALMGYIEDINNHRYRVVVDSSSEEFPDIVKNRPPSPYPENWGPWVLTAPSRVNNPIGFYVYAEHIKCPTEPETQRNLFVQGNWADFSFDKGTHYGVQ